MPGGIIVMTLNGITFEFPADVKFQANDGSCTFICESFTGRISVSIASTVTHKEIPSSAIVPSSLSCEDNANSHNDNIECSTPYPVVEQTAQSDDDESMLESLMEKGNVTPTPLEILNSDAIPMVPCPLKALQNVDNNSNRECPSPLWTKNPVLFDTINEKDSNKRLLEGLSPMICDISTNTGMKRVKFQKPRSSTSTPNKNKGKKFRSECTNSHTTVTPAEIETEVYYDDISISIDISSALLPTPTKFDATWKVETLSVPGISPCGRWGHASVLVSTSSSNKWIMYGGACDRGSLNDLYIFDLNKGTWEKGMGLGPSPRAWHSLVQVRGDDEPICLLYGGEDFNSGIHEMYSLSDAYDPMNESWFPITVTGSAPGCRAGHSATVVDSMMVIFGGGRDRRRLQDIVVFHADMYEFMTPVVVGDPPHSRSYHSAVAVGRRIIVFGGNGDIQTYKRIHVLDCDTWSWSHPITNGDAPTARSGHAAVAIDDYHIFIQGGWDPEEEGRAGPEEALFFSDGYILDVRTMTWTKVIHDSVIPPRCGHSACLRWIKGGPETSHGEFEVYLWGGVDNNMKFCNDMYRVNCKMI